MTARQASETAVSNAFRAALIPTINTMAAMGIVSLPGMMTGQILSGTAPAIAVRYQIAIMLTACCSQTRWLSDHAGLFRKEKIQPSHFW